MMIVLALIVLLASRCLSADIDSDKQALLEFASLVPHARKLNWNTTNPICTSGTGITGVTALRLPGSGLYGPLPDKTFEKSLYFHDNNFSGTIPPALSPRLVNLDLSANSLSGNIPASLRSLTQLTDLSLQNNSLTGPIPDLPPNLKYLNLSFNNLNGSVPSSLKSFPASSFQGNSLLCGSPLTPCPDNTTAPVKKVLSTAAIVGITPCPEKNKLVFFEGSSYNFDLEDLLRASAEVLGKGSYGTTYKAILEEGTTVVVKRLKEVAAGKREFEQQMEAVGRISPHVNVAPLRAYYFSKDEKLLGNNEGGRAALDWETRVKICLGAAKGIAHIHSASGAKLLHGNIKSPNVLLTQDLNACVSDYGIAPLMSHHALLPSRSFGYRAPEAVETRKHTPKFDVYSSTDFRTM
ncbi:hypothetical protein Bca52824_085453 [Brassica carinata]|uniref:Protein kinase domain-containing protein n=2 Tax=Brassica TaxID=3705 RepID=A0A8X7P741_BRACI|nr:hypothetical protein Bca52824_085453 [Brassica carinata]